MKNLTFRDRGLLTSLRASVALLVVVCIFGISSIEVKSKNFGRNNFNQEQASRNYYPSSYKRFRRGYGLRDEGDFNQFNSFGGGGSSDSFGTFRKGSLGSRKGASRSYPSRGYPAYGGPDAFLSSSTDEEEEEDISSVYGGNSGSFPSFGGSSSSWGKQISNSKGRSKGGIKKSSAAKAASPTSINFGKENPRFGKGAGNQFSFGSSGSKPYGSSSGSAFGNSGSSSFGSSSSFGNKNYFGSFGNSKGRNKFTSQTPKNNFGTGGNTGEGFPNPFLNPGGGSFTPEGGFGSSKPSGSGIPFSNLGSVIPFSGKIEDLTGGKVVGPIKNFPDLDAFLEQLEPTTTTKKPLRVISEEDANKVFSGDIDEGKDDPEREISFGLDKLEPDSSFPNPFLGTSKGKGPKKSNSLKKKATCDDPEPPLNAAMRCTTYSGCRMDCNPGFQTPDGETRLYMKCIDGEWTVRGKDYVDIPDCEPVCDPPCQNSGICLAPNLCNCPDDFEGPQCDTPREEKKCSSKPPTPLNTRIFCGNEGCIARCIEGYEFEEGITKLSFVCQNGKWTIKNPSIKKIPNCKPICDPECLNGGICLAPNICECTSDYRGPQCQYPISNCDPKKLDFNGGYNCTGEGMDFGCKLWCPEGIDFTFHEASFYKCDYATGKWSPYPIPECDYSFLEAPDELDLTPVVTHTKSKSPQSGTCFTWSGSHYKTFDGKVYSFESGCPYTLLQDANLGTFSVNLMPTEGCSGPKCPRSLKIFTEGDQYILESSDDHPVLTYRDTSLAIPGQMNGLVSERVAHFVVVKLTGIGLTLKWDLMNLFVAEVSEVLWNRTSGLCGRIDGSPENDWGYVDGSSESSINTFLNAWQATTVGAPCLEPPVTRYSCSQIENYKASAFCSRLSDDPRFNPCREVLDVDPYVTACKWDYCGCSDKINPETCACNTFAAFFRECANSGGGVPGGWRSSDLCPLQCDEGLDYKACMPAIQARCGQAADTAKPDFCVEGCDCPVGLVLGEAGNCVRPELCPCTYHNKTYFSGDTIPNECNSCTCLSGEWVCTEVKCGSRCSSVGDPHYTTFDGRKFDFMGKCSYYLVRGGDFSIEAENTPCAGAISKSMNFPSSVVTQFPSCTKSLTLRVPGTIVHLKQGREVTINGEEVSDLPLWANEVFVKKASDLFVMVYLPNGIEVWWDGQTRAYVDAPPDMRGLLSGLCGTFNDNQKDDFLTPEGDNEQNPIAFANKWKTSRKCGDMPLSEEAHPCDRHVQNKEVAEKYCTKIKSKLFADCHLEVDPEPFYRDCIYDLCSCEAELKSCLCPVLAAYGKECARKGILVDWRAKIRHCGIHCSRGQKYQICGDSCSHTCYDLAVNPDCKRKCVEGCNCPDGFSLDASEICVPVSQCPCVYDGKEFKPGYEMFQKSTDGSLQLCKCEKAEWKCRNPTDVERNSPEFFTEPQVTCLERNHELYTDCLPEEEPTCLTMHMRPEEQSDVCRSGCRCDTGYVRDQDSNKCIPYHKCPCHHGGKSYQEGETIIEDCNTCICEEGLWSCSEDPCPATCTAWGDSHFKTFDGRMFDFHGTCDYMLAKGKLSRADVFEVSIQNVPCGTNGVTCAKSLTLRVGSGDSQEVVHFSRNKPPPMRNMTRTIIREAGVFIFAEVADMGLELQWDRGTRAYIILDPSWKGTKVQGLCGNFNGDEKDDFRTPSGGSGEVSAKIFGDSWRLQNYCPESVVIKDTCSIHPHRKVWASERCATLKSKTFSACHSEVPVEPYIERCQFDACGCDTGGDCHCLCTAIAAYAQECNMNGVYIKWRKPNFCPMQCDESCERYEPCIPTCPQETCDSYKEPQSTLCRRDPCVEGCAKDICPPGQVHKSSTDKECVPKADCDKKCLEIDGEVFLEGDIITEDECHTCHCTKGKKICKGSPCETTTPFLPVSTSYTPRVTTPKFSTPYEKEGCKTGWSKWISHDHPIVYKKNSDIESIPERIMQISEEKGHCGRDMYEDIRCRTIGDHQPPANGVICNLEEGLRCERPKGGGKGGKQCADYEISILCDCSKEVSSTTPLTTPEEPVTAPPVLQPSTRPPLPDTPETCEMDGWTNWFNVHFPTKFGEFETLDTIREYESICPDHYVKEVECRPATGGVLGDSVVCDKKGAICRNNGDFQYCEDIEVRILCQCECQDGLGIEDGMIPDDKITFSSSSGGQGRLNSDAEWIPALDKLRDLSDEWVQVDLGEKKEVTGITSQGHSKINAYVTTYAVQVSETGTKWTEIRDEGVEFAKRFTGNQNSFEEVVNLFPKPVFVRYLRLIPLEAQIFPALRFELKGCDVKEEPTKIPFTNVTALPLDIVELTTPFPSECQDGWTEWMNSHVPAPGDWDDIENYKGLRMKYGFCDELAIQRVQCRVSTIQTPYKDAGQVDVICNKNAGLQCADELQKGHCYDYEIRFYCDCSLTTTSVPTVYTTTASPEETKPGQPCDLAVPTLPHESDCQKFYECQFVGDGFEVVEKVCGPGTLFNPGTLVCDHQAAVWKIKPECIDEDYEKGRSLIPSCEDKWTAWFNVSSPETDEGDFESIDDIRDLGLDICDPEMIKDIECRFTDLPSPIRSKGGRKGRPFAKGRAKPDRYTSIFSDVSESEDIGVICNAEEGLKCVNRFQRDGRCHDYSIRVLCSCEEKPPTSVFPKGPKRPKTDSPFFTTTVVAPTNYTDVRTATPTTSPRMYNDYWCPSGKYYEEFAIRCVRVCLYYRQFLMQQARCLDDDDLAPACVDEVTGQACPPGFFLRDNSTCVTMSNCNCMLPNGMSAPPERTFLVSDCEICKCSENDLLCDNSRCYDKPKEFDCDEWSPWYSVSAPSGQGDMETLEVLGRYHPDVCDQPEKIECREKDSGTPFYLSKQKVTCNTKTGFQCLNKNNPDGCKDYEVRIFCKCEPKKEIEHALTPSPDKDHFTTTPLPPLPGCVEPYWTDWFNVTHPVIKGGDYELIDVIIRDGYDICPKPYITKLECAFYKQVQILGSLSKSRRKFAKGRPAKYTTTYTLTDYTESDDMYVTCSKFSGLTCVNSLQARSKKCQDYAIRAYCNCESEESEKGEEDFTPSGTTSTTPYPGWPVVGPGCEVGVRVECGIECFRICMFYKHYLKLGGDCPSDDDCAPACMKPSEKSVCPDGLFMADNSTCVEIADCTCRLPNGQPLPGGMRVQVSKCEWCECSKNELHCDTTPGCYEGVTEPIIQLSSRPDIEATKPTTTRLTTPPPLSLIKINCNEWTPWMNMKRTAEGDFQRLEDLRAQYEELCEKPLNISCRDAIAKLPAGELDQTITCSTEEGLICRNDENREDCFDYEVSLFCECDEDEAPIGKTTKPTTDSRVTTELAPCDSFSPWINEHKPWFEDGDVEFKTLDELKEKFSFCTEGYVSDIECLEASSGMDVSVNKGVRCDEKFGLRCKNEEQENGLCYDFKIRYYCTCGTTVVTRPTIIVPTTPAPPSVCDPDKYLKLLEYVDDSAFSATSSLSPTYGPASARLYTNQPYGGAWTPRVSNRNQYLQVDLRDQRTIYGFFVSGSARTSDRVTSFAVMISEDNVAWSPLSPKIFPGPRKSSEEKLILLPGGPVEAQYVKFVPNTWSGNIAMRIEIVGCSIATPTPVTTTTKPLCVEEMGLENGALKDHQISVSSVLDDRELFFGKRNVRLNSKPIRSVSAGAWVAKPLPNQFIRFDFLEPSKVSGLYTQGREGTDEYVETFTLRYSPDGKTWSSIKEADSGEEKLFFGNYDSTSVMRNLLDRVVETRYLEIRPMTYNKNIAMRIEILGCFHPYPTVTTPLPTTSTTTQPPPPYCDACPGLPPEYYKKCHQCSRNEKYDGDGCVPDPLCPCYHNGIKYRLGSYFETTECEKCVCEGGGKTTCKPIECPACNEEGERPVQTPSCDCVCKPCPEGTTLCPSNDFCLDDKKWCDGIENCPDDEEDCPTLPPQGCPVLECPDEWELRLELEGDDVNCPKYSCDPPQITTPMSCPHPLCPFGYNIVMIPKKPYEACPKYECEPPVTTLEPYTCPPPACPGGYDVETMQETYEDIFSSAGQNYYNYDQQTYDTSDGCPQYKCVTNAPPTAPCPPPSCPQGYDVSYPNIEEMLSLCPTYECLPIVTTTACPPVECPKGLQTLFVQTDDICPQYTCIKVTTPVPITPSATDLPCREVALPVCEPGEEIYQANPTDPCPIFKCKKIGAPPPTTAASKVIKPTCEVKNKDFTTFDGSELRLEPCNHVLARDKIAKKWEITLNQNCSSEPCGKFLQIREENTTLALKPDLSVLWDENTYTVAQAQKIGEKSQKFSVAKVGDSIVYKSQTYEYTIIWNVDMNIKIEVGDDAIYQVDGLCGLYSGSPVDDRTKPDGSLTTSTKEFGDAWTMPEKGCKKPPKKCSPEESKKAFLLCNALDSKPFTECHDVLPVENYLKGCVDRLCVCLKENRTEEECKCGVLASYITACLEKKPDAKVADWRIVTKCYKECPPGEVYNDCYKAPCEKSCENLLKPDACEVDELGPCISGCFCEPGLVRKGDSCVVPEKCRDCMCEGYGDPHYKSFDRKNFTFNGECSYIAARDIDPTGEHQFQVIIRNKRCQRDPITMCTDSVQVLYDNHKISIELLPSDNLVTSIDGVEINEFPKKEDWVSMESPDENHVRMAVPAIELEVSYSKDNYGFNVRVPSHLFYNKLEGLCGNCNNDPDDDLKTIDGEIVESVNDFGSSWVKDHAAEGWSCRTYDKETEPCLPPAPEHDLCLKLMDKEAFGICHPLEDPVAYVSSCQLDMCLSLDPKKSACQSLEAYARRCAQLGACLDWRGEDLCPKTCPEGLEYVGCGPGCIKTCDNYEDLKSDPSSCELSPSDGCYCPDNLVFDNGNCVNESNCITCDADGHRVGEVWKTDNCTTCECADGTAICRTKSCPHDPVCNDGYIIEEIPGTDDECCGPQKTCKVKPLTDCPDPVKPSQNCGYGKRLKLIETPGVCPEYACVCLEPDDCPELETPSEEDLKPGEEWELDAKGCCPRFVPTCTGDCPLPECQEFYTLNVKPLREDQCCPDHSCEPPTDACIYEPSFVVEGGFERPLKDEEIPDKKLFEVGEKWLDGLCIECECAKENNVPVTKCIKKTCTELNDHPDRNDYVLTTTLEPNTCCPKITRTACIEDGESFEVNETQYDELNSCRSLECKRNREGRLEKVEQIFSCDENCPFGWQYEPSPLFPMVCCGSCEQVACDHEGELKEVGETWQSPDLCTVYECIRDSSDKVQTRATLIQCSAPTEEEKVLYLFTESEVEGQCCPQHTRISCLINGVKIPAGQEIADPDDKCLRIVCEMSSDGNVTRREKEQACSRSCPMGHVYSEAPPESDECCGTCLQTHCVDNEKIHPIGDTWENPKDICYQYTCDLRDDVLTVVAIKRECPYFDPTCPAEEIYQDVTGCCKLCNITRETKRECQPEEIDALDTIGMFLLEARTVGRCTNPSPVYGFKRCNGQCDSKTIFRAQGIEARHISECNCCKPSRMSEIKVILKCNRGYSFERIFDNIEACECQPCDSYQKDDQYVNDQPMADLTEFNVPLQEDGVVHS